MGYSGSSRGAAVLSGIFGVGVIIVSSVLLAQTLGYRTELGYLFGYQLPNLGGSSAYYNRGTYSVFGYELDPLIGISSGGIVVGLLQLISSFFLCCGKRSLSVGWAVFQVLILIGVIVCFALAIYFEVYSYRNIPGYGLLGLGGGLGGLGQYSGLGYNNGINPGFINPYQQQQLLQNQALLYNQQAGLGGSRYSGSGFIGDYICNPSGQAYVGLLGIDIVVIIGAMILVGIASRSASDDYVHPSSTPPHLERRYKA